MQSREDIGQLLVTGQERLQVGDKETAHQYFTKATEAEPWNELAWLWRAGASSDKAEMSFCLQRVLTLNPNNRRAQTGLEWLETVTPEEIKARTMLPGPITNPFKTAAQAVATLPAQEQETSARKEPAPAPVEQNTISAPIQPTPAPIEPVANRPSPVTPQTQPVVTPPVPKTEAPGLILPLEEPVSPPVPPALPDFAPLHIPPPVIEGMPATKPNPALPLEVLEPVEDGEDVPGQHVNGTKPKRAERARRHIICPRCRSVSSDLDATCSQCGYAFFISCTTCHTLVESDVALCPKCGNDPRIPILPPIQIPEVKPGLKPRKSINLLPFFGVLTFLAFITFVFAIFLNMWNITLPVGAPPAQTFSTSGGMSLTYPTGWARFDEGTEIILARDLFISVRLSRLNETDWRLRGDPVLPRTVADVNTFLKDRRSSSGTPDEVSGFPAVREERRVEGNLTQVWYVPRGDYIYLLESTFPDSPQNRATIQMIKQDVSLP